MMLPVGTTGSNLGAHVRQAAKTAAAHLGVDEDQFFQEQLRGEDGKPLPELPDELAFIYQAFLELSCHRTSGVAGFDPIALSEIDAWQRINRAELDLWEIRIIQQLDGVWLKTVNGRSGTTRDQSQEPGGAHRLQKSRHPQ